MDLNDKTAWDDSTLIDAWDEALEEYKKYHSIHISGKKLEDVLSKEEMSEVYAQRRALKGAKKASVVKVEARDGEKEMSISHEREIPLIVEVNEPEMVEPPLADEEKQQPTTNGNTGNAFPPMPAIVGVEDEGLKNLLMSWYYAGYHTGLYEGRQQAQKEKKATYKT